jgi:hypothetical protein
MTKQKRNTLKGYFETGKKPTGGNYADLLDSYLLVNHENTGSIDIQGHITVQGSITASGDISASGTIFADTFQSHGSTEIGVSDSLNVTGGITASNISSSGYISASSGDFGEGDITNVRSISLDTVKANDGTNITIGASWGSNIYLRGPITTSTHISSSGDITASGFLGDGSGLTNITASSLEIQQITASYLSGSIQATGSLTYTSGSTSVLYAIQSSGSIIPDSGSSWDLGGPDNVWRDLWLSENSMRFVSTSGEITRFRQEDARRLRSGEPPKLATAIAGFNSIMRPEAVMSPLNTMDYTKYTIQH